MRIVVQNHSEVIDLEWINNQFEKFSLTMEETIPVIFFPNKAAFDTSLNISSPSWVVATQDDRNIYIVSPSAWNSATCLSSVEEIIVHEAAHVFHQRIKRESPIWIFEGFAMLIADQIGSMTNTNVILRNPYELDYKMDNIYAVIGKIMSLLINKHGCDVVVRSVLEADEYTDDSILGIDAILEIIK